MLDEAINNTTHNRLPAVTQKIGREQTGLNGALFVHVDFYCGRPVAISFSAKGKDDSTLDKILQALGDTATSIIRDGAL